MNAANPLPSAGEIDAWIDQRLAEFDDQRRRGQQDKATEPAPSSNGGRS